jgi:hypothetical protein
MLTLQLVEGPGHEFEPFEERGGAACAPQHYQIQKVVVTRCCSLLEFRLFLEQVFERLN